jgi:aerobic carbon-monoxide dehydrogenase small subunit
MAKEITITLNINGRPRKATVATNQTLLEVLRGLEYFDVKSGCEKGDCGACAVLVDGSAVDSCLTLAGTVDGRSITTVSGLGKGDDLHPLQKAFTEMGSIQCGYCTPGLIIAAKSLLDEKPNPTDDDLRLGLSGNLCRCTGYTRVFEAIHVAAKEMREGGEQQ